MSKVHDMGGREEKRPIPFISCADKSEELSPTHWTSRTLAITLAMGFLRVWNLDSSRFFRESLPKSEYLSSSYYKRWFLALEKMIENFEIFSNDNAEKFSNKVLQPEEVCKVLKKGSPSIRSKKELPTFSIGDEVLTRTNFKNVFFKRGHTRLPEYAMGKKGRIILYHRAHVYPDSNAHFKGEAPEYLYTVEFSSEELWGKSYPNRKDAVTLDLWEPYLKKANEAK